MVQTQRYCSPEPYSLINAGGFQWSNVTALGFCPAEKRKKKVNVNTDYCQSSTCSQHSSTLGSFSVHQFDARAICRETDWFRNFREYLYMPVYNSLCLCMDGCVCVDVPRLMTLKDRHLQCLPTNIDHTWHMFVHWCVNGWLHFYDYLCHKKK